MPKVNEPTHEKETVMGIDTVILVAIALGYAVMSLSCGFVAWHTFKKKDRVLGVLATACCATMAYQAYTAFAKTGIVLEPFFVYS